jgi:type II secretory pathway component PulF
MWVFRYAVKEGVYKTYGYLRATSAGEARNKLQRAGINAEAIVPAPWATLKVAMGRGFDSEELAGVYERLAQSLANSGRTVDGLDGAREFITDPRLADACAAMHAELVRGEPEDLAMKVAGFSVRDCMVVSAAREAGALREGFLSLGKECERAGRLEKRITGAFSKLRATLVMMFVAVLGYFLYIGPMSAGFAMKNASKMPPGLRSFFEVVLWAEKNRLAFASMYLLVGAGIFVFIQKGGLRPLLDRLGPYRRLMLRGDLAACWGSMMLLIATAGQRPAYKAGLAAQAAKRADVAQMFKDLAKLLDNQLTYADAVPQAGFPPYVSRVWKQAANSSQADAAARLVRQLNEDVDALSEKFSAYMGVISMVIAGLLVLLLAGLMYAPNLLIFQSVLKG